MIPDDELDGGLHRPERLQPRRAPQAVASAVADVAAREGDVVEDQDQATVERAALG